MDAITAALLLHLMKTGKCHPEELKRGDVAIPVIACSVSQVPMNDVPTMRGRIPLSRPTGKMPWGSNPRKPA